jgi:hypothetical protein
MSRNLLRLKLVLDPELSFDLGDVLQLAILKNNPGLLLTSERAWLGHCGF